MGKNASTTYKTFLLVKSGSGTPTYKKVIDIIDYSDSEGDPEMLDTSTLSDRTATGITGQGSMNTNTFTVLYNPTTYAELVKLEDDKDHDFALAFGGTESASDPNKFTNVGSDGVVEWSGRLSAKILGAGFNEVRHAQITISSSTSPKWSASLSPAVSVDADFATATS